MTTIRLPFCLNLLPLACAAALLTACGGGGGDPVPTVVVPTGTRTVAASAGSDATAAGLSSLGGWVARAVLSASGDGAFDVTGQQRESPLSRSTGAVPSAPTHARLALALARRALPAGAQRERPAAISTETLPCLNAGGSMTFTIDDADQSQTLTAADLITVVANNCVIDDSLPATNGRMALRINAVELDTNQVPVALDASATLTQFNVGGYGSFNGSMRLWSKPEGNRERARVSYQGASVTYAAGTAVFNFDVYGLGDAVSGSFDIQGGIGVGGQTYALATGSVLAGSTTNPPDTGVVSLRDAAGDAVRLTVRNASRFDLDFLPSGSSVPTASLPGLLWSDYLAPGF